ncbi:MAG: calcium-binding protein, partial [Pseudomonadota bacterium]
LGDATVSPAAAAAPTLRGSGVLPDLNVAATADATLLGQLQNFAALPAASDWAGLRADAAAILLRWAGADAVQATPLGDGGVTADQLAALEAYFGRELAPRDPGGAPDVRPAAQLDQLWDSVVTQAAIRLAVQGPWASVLGDVDYDPAANQFRSPAPDSLAQAMADALDALPADPVAADAAWSETWGPALRALSDALRRQDGTPVRSDYVVQSLARADQLSPNPLSLATLVAGLGLEDVAIGGVGADALSRAAGSRDVQTFVGGAGDDTLTGGAGQDVYVFAGAWGEDRILDAETAVSGDRLRFADRTASELSFSRAGDDLIVTTTDGANRVAVVDHFAAPLSTGVVNGRQPAQGVEEVQFADGVVWSQGQVAAAVGRGSAAAELITGSKREDILEGMGGDDTLRGGDGGDIYVYTAGDGADRIEDLRTDLFLKAADALMLFGISPEDLSLSRSENGAGDDIILSFADGGSLTLVDQAAYDPISYGDYDLDARIEAILFDGPTWTWGDLQQEVIADYATEGDDLVTGFGTPDLFEASAGDDTLRGLDGGDTYRIEADAGRDRIEDGSRYVDPPMASLIGVDWKTADVVAFADGIAVADVAFHRDGPAPDLRVSIGETADALTVAGQFAGQRLDLLGILGIAWFDRIERFEFADGSVLTWEDVLADVTTGGDGDDALYGAYYRDTLDGKAGDDTLSGGDDGDLYLFGRGYGQDLIEDAQTNVLTATEDVVRFGAGVSVADVAFGRAGRSLDLTVALDGGTADLLTIRDQYQVLETGVFQAQAFDRIERFEWADGTSKSWGEVAQAVIDASATAGDDLVVGTHFDDSLAGGAGADTLEGGNGSDVYAWGSGDGDDRILDHWSNVLADNRDRLDFIGLNAADLSFTRAGTGGADLVATNTATGEALTIEGQFAYGPLANVRTYEIERFGFADGSDWTAADLRAEMLTRAATAGDDLIEGFQFSDRLSGGSGNDTLRGGDGSDVYVVEANFGQDRIEESWSFAGYGETDRIEFGAGLAATDITLAKSGDDLVIGFAGRTDTLALVGQFAASGYAGALTDIEILAFADGTQWRADRIASETLAQATTAGDDLIEGFFTADRIDGGAGDDTLRGGTGGDSYLFGAGSGQDRIEEAVQDHLALDGPDRILFEAGLTLADVAFARVGDDMVVSLTASADTLTIAGHYASANNRVELFEFADGTVLTALEATGEAIASAATPGDDLITGGN